MLKRIFALCLILTLGLSLCFAIPTSAAAPSERQLVYDLGIVAEPSAYGLIPKAFNRASFAKALTVMTKTKPAEAVTAENAAKYASDIATHANAGDMMNVLIMGYMQVDEAGKFNPNQPITKQDAVTSFIKALGYETIVKANGGEAGDYLLQASKLGILKGVTIADESRLTAEEVAKMVANAMGVPFIAYEGIIGNPSCLWELWELSVGTGVIEANSNIGIGVSKVAANRVRINGTTLHSCIEIPNELVGTNVTYYMVPGDRGNEVVSIYVSGLEENVTLTGDDIESVTDRGRYIEIVDIKDDKIMVDKQGYLMLNGKVQTPTKTILNMLDSGEATFIDTNDDGYYDVIHMTLLYQVVVEGVNADTMAIRTGYDKQIISFKAADVLEVYMGKKVVDFSQIKAGMVIGIACDAFTLSGGVLSWNFSNAKYVKLYVSSRKETGMIDGIEGDDTFSINDVKQEYGSSYKRLTDGGYMPELKLGYYVNAFYDSQGKLAYYNVVGGSEALNYGYLIAAGVEPGALERTTKLKILDANSIFKEYATSKKFILDGAIVDSGSTLYNVNGTDVNLATRQVIRFRVFDGVIREIDTKVVNAAVEDTANTLDEVLASGTQTIRSGAISRRFVFASNSIMFVDEAPADAVNPSEKLFRVGKATDLSDDEYTLACYDANDDMEISCVVRKVGSGSSTSTKGLGANNYCYVVEKVARSVDEEGNPNWILSLAGNGARGNYLVPSETLKLYCIADITGPMEGASANEYPTIVLLETSTFESVIKTGDVVRISTNTAGNVTRIEKLFDFATHKDGFIAAQTRSGQSSAFVSVDKVKGSNLIYDNGTAGDGTKYVTERTTHYSSTVLYHVKTGEAELLPFSSIPSAATGNTVKAWIRFYNKGQNRDNIFYIYD